MARALARIPFIERLPDNTQELVTWLNIRITEINRVLGEVESEINQQKGNDGATPIFNGAPNMRQHRITNGERSREPRDFVIRQELIDAGILGSPTGKVVFTSDVEFAGGTQVTGPSGGTGIATGGFVEDAIEAALEGEVARNRDGERLTVEQTDGTDGATFGTAVLGRDQDGKARWLPLSDSGLKIDTSNLETLLTALIMEIQEWRDES